MSDGVTAISSPLAETLGAIRQLETHVAFKIGIPAEGWIRLSDIDEDQLESWYRQVLARRGDRPAAVAEVGGWLGYMAVVAWGMPAFAGWRLPLHDLGEIAIRMGNEYPDAIAYAHESVGVLADDPMADHRNAIVIRSRGEFRERLVERLEQVMPLFDRMRRVARIGKPQLWGEVADSVGAVALWVARDLGGDQRKAWAFSEDLTARLADRHSDLRARPAPFPVRFASGEALYHVRGTCCLYYRTCTEPDPGGDGYCVTCPLRTDESRTARLRRFLENKAESTTARDEGT